MTTTLLNQRMRSYHGSWAQHARERWILRSRLCARASHYATGLRNRQTLRSRQARRKASGRMRSALERVAVLRPNAPRNTVGVHRLTRNIMAALMVVGVRKIPVSKASLVTMATANEAPTKAISAAIPSVIPLFLLSRADSWFFSPISCCLSAIFKIRSAAPGKVRS